MFVGGLVGFNEGGTISESYATGAVSGDESVGGLVGVAAPSNIISSSHWITDDAVLPLVAVGTCTGCAKLTDAQGKQEASFNGWDFVYTWRMEENVSYPELQWQR